MGNEAVRRSECFGLTDFAKCFNVMSPAEILGRGRDGQTAVADWSVHGNVCCPERALKASCYRKTCGIANAEDKCSFGWNDRPPRRPAYGPSPNPRVLSPNFDLVEPFKPRHEPRYRTAHIGDPHHDSAALSAKRVHRLFRLCSSSELAGTQSRVVDISGLGVHCATTPSCYAALPRQTPGSLQRWRPLTLRTRQATRGRSHCDDLS